VITDVARRLWAEPRAPHAPRRVWRDGVLLAVVVAGALAEGLLRTSVTWRPFAVVLTVGLASTLLWRRTHPLAMVTVAFGALVVVDLASLAAGTDGSVVLGTTAFVLVLVYALFRWGSGREVVLGTAVVAVGFTVGMVRDWTTLGEALLGVLVVTFPAVLGVSVRLSRTSRAQRIDQVRLRERELLARELHDTVAHHVSAMVVRAQAGRVVGVTDPTAAVDALGVIEAEGVRTLAELRLMVGALRDGEGPDLAPGRGLADIPALAASLGSVAPVEVRVAGDVVGVGPSVGAAVYRIVQEALTNVARHARHPTRVAVDVAVEPRQVRCTVTDDGEPVLGGRAPGYGTVGMTERVTLLGGTIRIGPGDHQGWVVDAVLPLARVAA